MNQVNDKIGTDYKPFNYYGAPDAENVIVAMGSVCECAEEVVDYLNAAGEKVGLDEGSASIARSCRSTCVDVHAEDGEEDLRARPHQGARLHRRAALPGRAGCPERHRVRLRFRSTPAATASAPRTPPRPTSSPCTATWRADTPKKRFTIGIVDDVTHLSLDIKENPDTTPAGTHFLQVLGPGRGRHRRCEQELHQDHRRPHRYVCAGLFRLRLQEVRRPDGLPPAFRSQADQVHLLHQQG